MALTRTRLIQSNTAIAAIQDPLMVLNSGATTITSDVGLLINRDSGISPNVAIVWQESSKSLVVGLTSNSGSTNSNVFVSQYANVYMGNVYTTGGVYWAGNNSPVSSGGGSGTGTSTALQSTKTLPMMRFNLCLFHRNSWLLSFEQSVGTYLS